MRRTLALTLALAACGTPPADEGGADDAEAKTDQ